MLTAACICRSTQPPKMPIRSVLLAPAAWYSRACLIGRTPPIAPWSNAPQPVGRHDGLDANVTFVSVALELDRKLLCQRIASNAKLTFKYCETLSVVSYSNSAK